MKRVFVALLTGGLLAVFPLTPALAAPNPSGTGQPGAESGDLESVVVGDASPAAFRAVGLPPTAPVELRL
jgi:hypothetical protein